ncbi:MAG TPA: SDR family oxidoreductase [Puia sp.]|jgi:NAD(P)-dependent dehydrogenase (short-subunit alcohol dehydrogenase family)
MAKSKVWFITGVSRGFGRIWAEAALQRGDKVAATARNKDSLKDLAGKYGDNVFTSALDVTDRKACFAAITAANEHFGRLDIVVNNAGYGQFGAIEELSEKEARDQMETNFFGALWVTQAAIPIMRAQHSGHILQVSSIGGVTAFSGIGMYHASKWGLEGFTESLALEVAPFGIHVTLIEPAGYETDWAGSSAKRAQPISAYDEMRKGPRPTANRGKPEATGAAILKVVDSAEPPLRLFLGSTPLQLIKDRYQQRMATWEKWNDVSVAAQGTN